MSTIRTLFLFGLPVLMLAACRTPRKACVRAERNVARAVYLCPAILQATTRTDTVQVTVPGDAGAGEAQYTQAQIDSVVHLCNVLVNRSLKYNTERRKEHEAKLGEVQGELSATTQQLRALRAYVCRFDTVAVQDSLFSMRIWADSKGGIKYLYYVHPRTVTTTRTTTTPGVSLRDAPCPDGVATWWRTVALICMGLLLLTNLRKLVGLFMSMKAWAMLALLATTTGMAQTDSAAKAHEREWMRPATDGRMYHQLPPPANLVNAGLFLEHDARMQRTGIWSALIGGAASAVLWEHNPDVGRSLAAASGTSLLYFTIRSNRSRRKAGTLLQSGYRIDHRYEIIPDSVEVGPHMRIMPVR